MVFGNVRIISGFSKFSKTLSKAVLKENCIVVKKKPQLG